MDILMNNLDKLHTTTLGKSRILRNLGMSDCNVIQWIRKVITEHEVSVIRRGKNYYVTAAGCVFTIHAGSFTVITAKRI